MSRGMPVVSHETLVAGLRSDFAANYDRMYTGLKGRLGDVMMLDTPSDKLEEIFAYYESSPHPVRWDRGEAIPSKAFKAVQFRIKAKDWGIRVEWHKNDREDDQLRKLYERAQEAGRNFALLRERVFFQMIQGAADPHLLESIPNAPDGVPLYSPVDGTGADRFGVVGGNVQAGTGVADPTQIHDDFWRMYERFRMMQDTEGQPLFDDAALDQGVILYYAANLEQQFRKAFEQARQAEFRVVQEAAANVGIGGATPSNLIMDAGVKIELRPTQRITTNDWYGFLRGVKQKPIIHTIRRPLTPAFGMYENSDSARTTKQEYHQWDSREGYGVNTAFATVKVDN